MTNAERVHGKNHRDNDIIIQPRERQEGDDWLKRQLMIVPVEEKSEKPPSLCVCSSGEHKSGNFTVFTVSGCWMFLPEPDQSDDPPAQNQDLSPVTCLQWPVSKMTCLQDLSPGQSPVTCLQDLSPGPVSSDLSPGPVSRTCLQWPVSSDLSPGPVSSDLSPGPVSRWPVSRTCLQWLRFYLHLYIDFVFNLMWNNPFRCGVNHRVFIKRCEGTLTLPAWDGQDINDGSHLN